MFKESLLKLSDGSWLAITLDEALEHEPPTRDIALAYARVHWPDGLTTDIASMVSIGVPPDPKAAKAKDRIAAGQLHLAERAKGSKSEALHWENLRKTQAEASALREPTRLFPRCAFAVGGMRVLCGYHVHREPPRFRLIDIETELEVWSIDAAGLLDQISPEAPGTKPKVDPTKEALELTKELDVEHLAEAELQKLMQRLEALSRLQEEQASSRIMPYKIRLLSATEDRMLMDAGLEKILVNCEGGRFSRLARWPSLYSEWRIAARTARGFVFSCITDLDERYEVRHVSARDGAEIDIWRPRARRSLSGAAESVPPGGAFVACSLGGQVSLYETGGGAPLEIPKLLGLDKYDPAEVSISPSGNVIAMCRAFDAKLLMLYDRSRGLAASLSWPGTKILESTGARSLRSPTFVVQDESLLTLVAGKLDAVPLVSLDWQAPLKPAPPIKRRKTASLTLEGALKNEPLAGVADIVRSWFRPGVVLQAKTMRSDRSAVGASKAGGRPDLPSDCAWPRYRGTPMAFLLQVNLADVAAVEPAMGLPKDGLLSLFLAHDADFPTPSFYSESNADPEGCRVIYTASSKPLRRTDPPADMPTGTYEDKDNLCAYVVRPGGPSLPCLSNDRVVRARLTLAQAQAYAELVAAVNGDDDTPNTWATRLGGYPAVLQNDSLHFEAESYTRGLSHVDSTYALWEQADFQEAAQEWVQLFQLSEGKEGWVWGDAGLMHIMVQANEWKLADFTQSWSIGVCH